MALVGVVTGSIYNSHLQDALAEAERQKELAETYKYFHHIARAHMEWRDGDVGRVEPLLDDAPPVYRHWEWNYLKRLCHADLLTLEGHRPGGVFAVKRTGSFAVAVAAAADDWPETNVLSDTSQFGVAVAQSLPPDVGGLAMMK